MTAGTVLPAPLTAAGVAVDMLNRQAFEEALASLHAQVEKRRRRYLWFFRFNSVLAFVLVAAVLFYNSTLLTSIAQAIGRTTPISTLEILSLYFFAVLCAVSLVLMPVLRYQGSLKPEFALHRRVWQRLCEAMGDAELMPCGAEFHHQVRASGLFNEFSGIAERPGIKGRVGDYQFWIQEMAINSEEGAAPFCGIVIFGRSDHRLHGDDSKRNYKANTHDYDVVLQGEAAPFLPFVPLAGRLSAFTHRLHWDQVLLQRLQLLRDKAEGWFTNRHTKPALEAELAYEAQFLAPPDILEAYKTAQANEGYPVFQLSLQGNDYTATLRSPSPLFLGFSLFEPQFFSEKAQFIYELVQGMQNRG